MEPRPISNHDPESLEKDRQACWNAVHAVARRVDRIDQLFQDLEQTIPVSAELTAIAESPEKYVRINVTKNTKGYSYETTVSLRWTDGELDAETAIRDLLQTSDSMARLEIAAREETDRLQAA